jgi:hypothetical protein
MLLERRQRGHEARALVEVEPAAGTEIFMDGKQLKAMGLAVALDGRPLRLGPELLFAGADPEVADDPVGRSR